jgi:hypothetical protein
MGSSHCKLNFVALTRRPSGSNGENDAPTVKDITPEDMDRIVAILDRMLDLAVALDSPTNRDEFSALHYQLAAITEVADG